MDMAPRRRRCTAGRLPAVAGTAFPVSAQQQARCIDYTTHTPNDALIGLLYVAVTCGPALMSSRRHLRLFGLVSLVGVIAAAVLRVDELTSLWCVYVALVSVLILEHFRRQRADEAHRLAIGTGPDPLLGEEPLTLSVA